MLTIERVNIFAETHMTSRKCKEFMDKVKQVDLNNISKDLELVIQAEDILVDPESEAIRIINKEILDSRS